MSVSPAAAAVELIQSLHRSGDKRSAVKKALEFQGAPLEARIDVADAIRVDRDVRRWLTSVRLSAGRGWRLQSS